MQPPYPPQPPQPHYPQYPPQNPNPQPYPYYPYPPQMPQPPRRQPITVRGVLIVAGAVVASCLFCYIFGSVSYLLSARDMAQPTATAEIPTVIPTAIQQTAIPNPAIFAPTLGGTPEDFQATYTATDNGGLDYSATIAGQHVTVTLTVDDPAQSRDTQVHAAVIQVTAQRGKTWSTTTANAIAKMFLPADAKHLRDAKANGWPAHVYHSDALAATFNADQFTNDFGNVQVPVGTLYFTCFAYPPSTSGIGQCLISIGSY